jgi:RimJ/RimL family protein N-acetyltransferase
MKRQKDSALAGLKPLKGRMLVGSKVRLRDKKLSDVRRDYVWQSDPELARLDAAPVLGSSFPVYLLDYTELIHKYKANRYPLAIETLEGKHIGNCTCYDIDEDKAEAQLGIMIGEREYWDKGYGTDAINTMVNHVFLNTHFKRIYLKTLDWNLRAQKCFRNCGFVLCGWLSRNGNNFVVMELKRERWKKRQNRSLRNTKE